VSDNHSPHCGAGGRARHRLVAESAAGTATTIRMPHHGVLQNRDEQRDRRLLPADDASRAWW